MNTSRFGFIMPGTNQAIDLAVSDVNDSGGLLGSTLETNRRESGSDPTQFRQVLEQHCSSPRPRTDRPARMINYRYRETELPMFDA